MEISLNKKIAIIGGGPVGLTMAKLLQKKGMNVSVYERDVDAQARIWGGTLDLHKNSGQIVMQKAGLLDLYYAQSLPMGIHFANEKGEILSTRVPTQENSLDNPEINRNVLRTLLLDSLSQNTVRWNCKFTQLSTHQNKWTLQFENQPDDYADIVLIANGGMSKARTLVSDTLVEDTGTYIIQGDIHNPEKKCTDFFQRCHGNRWMTASNGYMFVANPLNNGNLSFGIIFEKPKEWGKTHPFNINNGSFLKNYILEKIDSWGAIYHQLILSADIITGLTIRKFPLDSNWKNDRPLPITLIGDAAHLMPPFAGQGVNIGLMDAMILADNFANGKYQTFESAIQDYEKQMFVYARKAQQESSENELKMRSPTFSFEQLIQH